MIPFATYEYRSRGYWGRLANVWPYGTDMPQGLQVNAKIIYR